MPTERLAGSGGEPAVGAPQGFQPIQLLDVALDKPLDALPARVDLAGRPYQKALALIRLHDRPVATVELEIPAGGLNTEMLAARLRDGLASGETAHLLSTPALQPARTEVEIASSSTPPASVAEREAFLARAPFASVVIATRNRPDNLARCLTSLLALVYPDFEIVVVDNAPSDDSTKTCFAREYGYRANMHYVREDRPGLASAHNRGLREMRGDSRFVAFTDDDVVVDPFWLCEMMRGFEAAANVGCVTGLIFPAELETWPQLLIEQFGGFNKGFRRQIYDLGQHRPPDRLFPFTPGRFGSGANMAFRTETLARIGGFDPAMGTGTPALGGDDLAAFFRVITSGEALVYEPAAIVRHTHYREYAALKRQIHGYGVGLTAFLTKAILDQPRLLLDLAGKLPRGLWYALSPGSGKNQKKSIDYPEELTKLERKGLLYGPLAYLRSRAAASQYDRRPPENAASRRLVSP